MYLLRSQKSSSMCSLLVTSYLFPFHELYPQINKVWLDPKKRLNCWGKLQYSPGEENLFLLYFTQFRQHIDLGLLAPNASLVDFLRENGWLPNRSDHEIKKLASVVKKRRKDPVEEYLKTGKLPRQHVFETLKDLCFVDFSSFNVRLESGQLEPLQTNVGDFLMQYTCKRRKKARKSKSQNSVIYETTNHEPPPPSPPLNQPASDDKMKLTEKQNIMGVVQPIKKHTEVENNESRIAHLVKVQSKRWLLI